MAESLDHVFKVLMIGDAGKYLVCQKAMVYEKKTRILLNRIAMYGYGVLIMTGIICFRCC